MTTNLSMVGTTSVGGTTVNNNGTNASTLYSTARPWALSDMGVSTGLLLHTIQRKLQIEATLDDVFVDVGADVIYTGKKVTVPDACVMNLKTTDKGQRTITIPMLKAFAGPGRGGSGEAQQGYERGMFLKYMKVGYNEYSQALIGEEWGVNYNDLQLFGFYNENQAALSKWFKEDLGMQYRQALLQTVAWPLMKTIAGTASTFMPLWNTNWVVPNTQPGSQPVLRAVSDTTAYTLSTVSSSASNTVGTVIGDGSTSDTSAIATALANAASDANGVNANIDLNYLEFLDYYASDVLHLVPTMIGGQKTYIVMLPAPQYYTLMKTTAGQLGKIWTDITKLTDMEQQLPGVVGRVYSLLIIKDQRYPTVTISSNTATVEYVGPGNDDARNKTIYSSSNLAWQIGFIMGQGAIVDWQVTPLHFEKEKTEYGKKFGYGAFTERGVQLGQYFDVDTSSSTSFANIGSAVLPFSVASIVNVA